MKFFKCFRANPDPADVPRPPNPGANGRERMENVQKVQANLSKKDESKVAKADTELATWEKKELSSLPADFLTVARGVQRVTIAENHIDAFSVDLTSLAPTLTILDISDNRISSLPPSLCALNHLECLYAYKNQLTSIPADIEKLQSLKEINVFNNKITELPAGIGHLPNLELLNAASNLLGKPPLPPLNGLTNLKRLALFWNKLTALPSLDGMVNVAEIQLAKNQLTSLPSLHTLTSLKSLSVNDNRLTAIPPSIGKCISLDELSASKNLIEVLPPELASCPNLTKIVLSQNRISMLPESVILPTYEKLDLADNQIEQLPKNIGGLKNLTVFFIQGNKLKTLPDELRNLTGIKRVDLTGNPLPPGLPLEDTLRGYCETNQGKYIGSQKAAGKK